MLYQPTNIYPSMTGSLGNGVVDAAKDLMVTWQVNGNSAMAAYQITIYRNDAASTQLYSTGKQTQGCPFYGVDGSGNVQFFSHTITAAALSGAGITNGGEYKLVIRQWWGSSDAQSVTQTSASAFITRNAPGVTLYGISDPLAVREYTFQAVYTQAQGDSLNWVRWQFALVDAAGEYETLRDTGKIYGTGELKFTYDGMFTGSRYAVRCSVQTQNGVEADTGWQAFGVLYTTEPIPGTLTACATRQGVRLTFPTVKSLPAEITGAYAVDDSYLTLPAGSKAVWDTQDGEAMALSSDCDIAWRGKADADGTVLKVTGDGLTAAFTIGKTPLDDSGSDQQWNCAFGAGVYVIAGPQGNIFWSSDLTSWTAATLGIAGNPEVRCVCYGGGKFVAFSERTNGNVYATYSTDGKTWAAPSAVQTSADIWSACYGNGMYLAAGPKDVLRCTDRVNMLWDRVESPNTSGVGGSDGSITIAFDGSKFLVPLHYLYVTTNGLVWSELREVVANYACFGGGIYLAAYGSTLYRSTDLLTWTQTKFKANASYSFTEIAYGDGVFLSCMDLSDQYTAGTSVIYSRDGKSWSAAQIPVASAVDKYEWYNACYGDSGFLIVNAHSPVAAVTVQEGTVEFEAESTAETVVVPAEKPEFFGSPMPEETDYDSICYGKGICVAVREDFIFVSNDKGTTWKTIQKSGNYVSCDYSPALDRFMILAGSGDVLYSTDGYIWNAVQGALSSISASGWRCVRWVDGYAKFIAVGPAKNPTCITAYSSDGVAWSAGNQADYKPGGMHSLAYGNGICLAAGSSGFWISRNGVSWETVTGITGFALGDKSIDFFNGKFYCILDGSKIASSANGSEWKYADLSNYISSDAYVAVSHSDGALTICFGRVNKSVDSGILYSYDGESFYKAAVLDAYEPNAVCYAGDRFISIGYGARNSGIIYYANSLYRYFSLPNVKPWVRLKFLDGRFWGVSDAAQATVWCSTDGRAWNCRIGDGDSVYFRIGQVKDVCAGSSGIVLLSGRDVFSVRQVDATGDSTVLSWLDTSSGEKWGRLVYGNGIYLAIGTNSTGAIAARSADCKNWSYSTAGLAGTVFKTPDVVFSNGVFVLSFEKNAIHRSADGINWTRYDLSGMLQGASVHSISTANGKFIVAPNGHNLKLLLSDDGASWENGGAIQINVASVAYGEGFYVAVGDSQTFVYSKDLYTWKTGSLPPATYFDGQTFWNAITFGNGQFAAVGGSNVCTYADVSPVIKKYHTLKFSVGGTIFAQPQIMDGGDMTLLLGNGNIQWDNHDQPYVRSGIAACYPGFENIRSLELDGKQECDYLMVSDGKMSEARRKKLLSDMTYHPVDQDAQFYADFNGSTNGGGVAGTQFTALSIYRLEEGRSVLQHIANVLPEDGSVIVDASAVNGRKYAYYAFGVGADTFVTSALISNSVELCLWDWAVLSCTADENGVYHVEELFLFGKNLVSGGVTNNNTPQILQNFTRYPTAQPAPQNYRSGTLQSLIGTITDCRYSDTREVRDAIWALSTTANTLFLKNRKGDLLRIRTAGAVEMDTGDNSPLQPQTVSLPWVEIGSAEAAQIVITRRDGAWGG